MEKDTSNKDQIVDAIKAIPYNERTPLRVYNAIEPYLLKYDPESLAEILDKQLSGFDDTDYILDLFETSLGLHTPAPEKPRCTKCGCPFLAHHVIHTLQYKEGFYHYGCLPPAPVGGERTCGCYEDCPNDKLQEKCKCPTAYINTHLKDCPVVKPQEKKCTCNLDPATMLSHWRDCPLYQQPLKEKVELPNEIGMKNWLCTCPVDSALQRHIEEIERDNNHTAEVVNKIIRFLRAQQN